ncbi:MAG TPA: tetratricopeptide repeat protein, partial [Anaeromyxobacter sp.]
MPSAPELADRPSPRGTWLLAAAVVAMGAAAYANALRAGFVYDDFPSIVRNPAVRDPASFLPGGPGYERRPNRAVGYMSFALDHRLHGLDPAWFHATNVAVHLASALLVFALVLLAFRTPRLRESRLAPLAPAVAFAAAALFVAHPVETQAVTYVVQRLTSLATLFYLAAVVLYLRARLGGVRPSSIAWYLGAILSALLATKTKEIAFTLPAALLACEALLLDGAVWHRALPVAPFVALAGIIPSSLVRLGKPAGEVLADAASATAVQTATSRLDYLATQLVVVPRYLGLLVLPIGQNADPDVAVAASFLEPRVLAGGLVLAALAAAAAVLARRGGRGWDPAALLAALGILWFFLAASVESSVIPIVDVMNEQRVYLPSAGLFLAAAAGLALLASRFTPRRAGAAAIAAAALVAIALGIATHVRNEVWRDQLSLWADAAAKSPRKPRPLNNLGAALSEAGRADEAAQAFLAAIRASPEHAEAYYNLGRLRMTARQDPAEAIRLFQTALALRPDYVDAYANLAGAYVQAGLPEAAVRVVEAAGPSVRDSAEAQFNLGVACALLGDLARAGEQVEVLWRLGSPLAVQLEAFVRSGAARSARGG